jgi:hypothetical protein
MPQKKPGFDVLLTVGNIAAEVRRSREDILYELNFDEQRKDIKNRILAAAKEQGEQINPEDVERATDLYFDRQLCFVEPKRGIGNSFANLYINRVKVGRKYGIPAAIVIGAAALILGSANLIKNANLARLERRTETRIETAYQQEKRIQLEIQTTSGVLESKGLTAEDRKKAEALLQDASTKLKGNSAFFDKYCSDGTASDDINRENYSEAGNNLEGVLSGLQTSSQNLTTVNKIFELQEALITARKSLDSLIGQVRSNNPPKIYEEGANAAYATGLSKLEARDIDGVNKEKRELMQIISDVKEFAVLPSKVEKVYVSLQSTLAKDEVEGRQTVERLHTEAQTYITSVNVPKLKEAVEQMQDIYKTTSKKLVLRSALDDNGRAGMDRYFNDKFSGWYLFVEAVDEKTGEVFPMQVTNSENNQTRTVRIWGERVRGKDPNVVERIQNEDYNDGSLLVRVIRDKLDNGIVDNNVFGKKDRGYIHYKLNSSEFEGKQITEW